MAIDIVARGLAASSGGGSGGPVSWSDIIDRPSIPGREVIDVVELPSSGIDEKAIYRLLTGTFVHDTLLRNDSTCYVVQWDGAPTGVGEPVLTNDDNNWDWGLHITGYYNVNNNTVYGYFDSFTIGVLKEYIDYLVDIGTLNSLSAMGLKAALNLMPTGWKTISDILSVVGSAVSLSWGGVITSINEATNTTALYILLSTDLFCYKNDAWISLDSGIGMRSTGIGAEIFNDPQNIASGVGAHAEGRLTYAGGPASHAEGRLTGATGPNSHAEGCETWAEGDNTHAEGIHTVAAAYAAHAEGNGTVAEASCAHAEGSGTQAITEFTHAEGYQTVASGLVAHAEGWGTIASGAAQHVQGKYNEEDLEAAFIIGGGSSDNDRYNIAVATWDGDLWTAGGMYTNGNMYAYGNMYADENMEVNGYIYADTLYDRDGKLATEDYVDAKIASVDGGGGGHVTAGLLPGSELGENATAEGIRNIASGITAHAEGTGNEASGSYAHAEGYLTKATGLVAHAEGWGTIANGFSQHVQGKFNVEDADAAFIIGGGTDETTRKNIAVVDWDGNAEFSGTVSAQGGRLITEDNFTWTQLSEKPFSENIEYFLDLAAYNFTEIYLAFPYNSRIFPGSVTIYFDGVEYSNLEHVVEEPIAFNYKYIYGNLHLYKSTYADNGLPFAFYYNTGTGGHGFYVSSDNLGEHTIGVYKKDIQPLDEKFLPESVDGVVIRSSTEGSTKKFKLTVDDSGTITATEVV